MIVQSLKLKGFLRQIQLQLILLVLLLFVRVVLEMTLGEKGMSATFRSAFAVLGIFVTTWAILRLIPQIENSSWFRSAFNPNLQQLIQKIIRFFVFLFAGLIAIDAMGISITPILASLGVGSIAVALALQDTLGNVFSGIYILLDQPIRVGDFIKLEDGTEGTVVRVGWRSAHIRKLSNDTVVIPNSKLSSTVLTNYCLPDPETAVLIEMGVAYQSNLEQVEKIVIAVAREVQKTVPDAVSNFEPIVRFHTFGESSIGYTVVLRVSQYAAQYLLKHEFIKALKKRFDLEGIEIPFPQRVFHIKSSDKPVNPIKEYQPRLD